MYDYKKVGASSIYPVRHLVLRAGKPVETCVFEGDNLSTTAHFACSDGIITVGAISIFDNATELFTDNNQFQLRGMAVLEDYQKKKIGFELVRTAENYIAAQGGKLIWFNARLIAVPFYEKLGYQKIGKSFNIGDIGAHFVMFKEI